ncbi:hypothetical protein CAY91_34835 [Pseudomonas aeruginosa]|nr:hypothetical protein CAY91_34835 [Pseudomonas aeruginosa]
MVLTHTIGDLPLVKVTQTFFFFPGVLDLANLIPEEWQGFGFSRLFALKSLLHSLGKSAFFVTNQELLEPHDRPSSTRRVRAASSNPRAHQVANMSKPRRAIPVVPKRPPKRTRRV